MSVINTDTKEAFQKIANEVSLQRPDRGKRVEVVEGRKHLGKVGIVMVQVL